MKSDDERELFVQRVPILEGQVEKLQREKAELEVRMEGERESSDIL